MELGAEAVDRLQHIGVALHPAQVVGPGGPRHREGRILPLQRGDCRSHAFRGGGAIQVLPQPVLLHRLNHWQIPFLHPGGLQQLQIFSAVDRHRLRLAALRPGDLVVGLQEGRREFIHHHAAVFAVGDLGDDRRHRYSPQLLPIQPQGFVIGLHLAHQLGVGALGFDQRHDRDHFPL